MRTHTTAWGIVALALASFSASQIAAEDAKATEVMAAARKAIGGKKLDELTALSVQTIVQRNISTMQLTADVELLLQLPDKYVRNETSRGGMMAGTMSTGFNGDRPIQPSGAMPMAGGGMVIRMGPGGPVPGGNEKVSPEERERLDKAMVRGARTELSRLMLGWFAAAHPAMNVEYTLAGEAESADGKAWVIDAKNADGFAARLFVDQVSSLPLMVSYQAPQSRMMTSGPGGRTITTGGPAAGAPVTHAGGTAAQAPPGRELTDEERRKARDAADAQIREMQKQPPVLVDFTLYFEDWRTVDGVKFPHKIRRATGGATAEEWTIEKVRINPKIDAKKFEVQS